jgi:hypothetical protein
VLQSLGASGFVHVSQRLPVLAVDGGCHEKGIVTIGALVLILGVAPASFARRPLTIRLGVHGAVRNARRYRHPPGLFQTGASRVEWRRFGVGREGRDAMIASAIDINATATTPFLIGGRAYL